MLCKILNTVCTEIQSEVPENHARRFVQSRDSRNRKVPALWVRNGRFYACLWVDRGDGKKTARRFPLEAANISEAREQLEVKKNDRRDERLPNPGLSGR